MTREDDGETRKIATMRDKGEKDEKDENDELENDGRTEGTTGEMRGLRVNVEDVLHRCPSRT